MNLREVLLRPIPDLSVARESKNYRDYPMLTDVGPYADEPLVAIEDYGLAGQSYYSRENSATGGPVPGVEPTVYLRRTVAEKLAAINFELQRLPVVEELFGGKVELYVDEGYRGPELQKRLYEEVFPRIIRDQYPEWNDDQVFKRRDQLSARPGEESNPSPHATGGPGDYKLRYCQENPKYVPGCEVDMGHRDADTSELTYPDYYEHLGKLSSSQKLARSNRRAFYWIMRGALNGADSGFEVNPTEWWHWCYGDQLWAQLRQAPGAIYGWAKLP